MSNDVPCSSQLHSVIWEIKGIWIFQCFHGLVGPVLYEQGAWTPLIYWAPQLSKTIAAWGNFDNCRRTHLQQTVSPYSCHTLQYLPISAEATTIVKWACAMILLIYHKPLGGLWPNDHLDLYIWTHMRGWIPHSVPTSSKSLPLFLSLPLSALFSTLSFGPYYISIAQHCVSSASKDWAL